MPRHGVGLNELLGPSRFLGCTNPSYEPWPLVWQRLIVRKHVAQAPSNTLRCFLPEIELLVLSLAARIPVLEPVTCFVEVLLRQDLALDAIRLSKSANQVFMCGLITEALCPRSPPQLQLALLPVEVRHDR